MAGNRDLYQKSMNMGHSAAWDQEWEKAAAHYRAAVNEFPDDPRALTSLGLALYELQNFDHALKVYSEAAKHAPQDPAPQEKIGRIYERMGRLSDATSASSQAAELHLKNHSVEKAIENWQRVLSITPENIPVRMRLAAVYERLNRKEDAVAEYISAASLLQRAGQQANAMRALEMAAKVLPQDRDVRMAAQMVRSGQQLPRPTRPRGGTGPVRMANVRGLENQGADSNSGSSSPLDEARQKALLHLAGLLFDEAEEANAPAGRSRGLNALTRGIAELSGNSGDTTRIMLHIGQAVDSLTQNNEQQSAVELEHAVTLGLRQPAAYYLLGFLLRERSADKAVKYLQHSVKHPDFTLASNLLTGSIYEAGQRWNEAVPAYLMALAAADSELIAADQRERMMASYDALIDTQTPDTAAQQTICQTVRTNLLRDNWRAYLQQARQQLSTANDPEPAPLAELLLETSGSSIIEAMARIRKLASQGYVRTALEEALFALQDAPSYLPLHVLVGDLLLQDQHISEAVAKYLVVAELYSIRGEISRAAKILRQLSQLLPTDFAIRQKLIDLFVSQENIEEALEEQVHLGELFYQLADLDKARQTYLDALQTSRRSKNSRDWGVKLLLKVADIDMQRLNLRQALRIYEQIRVIQPNDRDTQAQIVALYFRLGDDVSAMKELDEISQYLASKARHEEAITMVKSLLEEYPYKVDLHGRLAELYVRSRQQAQAVAHLDATAEVMMRNQRPGDAARLIEMIISLKPNNVRDYQIALTEVRKAVKTPERV